MPAQFFLSGTLVFAISSSVCGKQYGCQVHISKRISVLLPVFLLCSLLVVHVVCFVKLFFELVLMCCKIALGGWFCLFFTFLRKNIGQTFGGLKYLLYFCNAIRERKQL